MIQARNGRLPSRNLSRCSSVAIATSHTNTVTGAKPATTRSHDAPIATRTKKYAPAA